jgi:hypothetical protein
MNNYKQNNESSLCRTMILVVICIWLIIYNIYVHKTTTPNSVLVEMELGYMKNSKFQFHDAFKLVE